jgi:hypothetical protein
MTVKKMLYTSPQGNVELDKIYLRLKQVFINAKQYTDKAGYKIKYKTPNDFIVQDDVFIEDK